MFTIIKKDFNILETGCGGSSLFYLRRCNKLTSLEHDRKWLRELEKIISLNNVGDLTYDYLSLDGKTQTIKNIIDPSNLISVVWNGFRFVFIKTNLDNKAAMTAHKTDKNE